LSSSHGDLSPGFRSDDAPLPAPEKEAANDVDAPTSQQTSPEHTPSHEQQIHTGHDNISISQPGGAKKCCAKNTTNLNSPENAKSKQQTNASII
jgi:hypothetical protein